MSQPLLLIVDLFCGAGGSTTGFEQGVINGKKVAKVIACVNHDENAIRSHKENHPDCLHFTEDIRTLDLTALITICRHARKMNPAAKLCLNASLECTEYSKAKGGLARDADSRTLAEDLFRYTDAIDFDVVLIENVEEFTKGGPMRIKPKASHPDRTDLWLIKDRKTGAVKYGWEPLPERRGEYYWRWVNKMKSSYDYDFDSAILNAANYGAHTSRKRYFGIFAKKGNPIVFPEPTHSKKPILGLKLWKPVKEVLDFSDEGESIFTRKKDLSLNTMERIYAGLIKYVAKGDTSFIQKHYSGRPKGKVNRVEEPCATITTVANLSLVQTRFLALNYSTPAYLASIDQPCPTLSTKDRISVVSPDFIVPWIDQQYGNGGNSSVESPLGSIPTIPKANLATAWLLSPHFRNKGNSVEEPAPVITANRKHHCLMFPQWGVNCAHSVESPSPVLPARMDKMMPQFIQADETGAPFAIAVFDDDSEIVVKIKTFMAAYGIVDIKMRMLRIPELKKITGFDENYILKGTQQDQKRYIGNAVPVKLAQAIIESFAATLDNPIRETVAA